MRAIDRVARAAASAAAIALGLAACTAGRDFVRPKAEVPSSWSRASQPGAPSAIAPAPAAEDWWQTLGDPALTSLIARARTANLDLRQVALRIAEARAARAIAGSAAWPSLSANASYTRQELSEKTAIGSLFGGAGKPSGGASAAGAGAAPPGGTGGTPGFPNPFNQYQAGFDASWEIDLFGRVRRSMEAANADLEASLEAGHDAQMSLFAELARTYFDLRGAQLRREVVERNVAIQREVAGLERELQRAGLASELQADNAEAQQLASQAQIPPLEAQAEQDLNRLSLLLAREPGALREQLAAAPMPPLPPQVAVGVPSDLLRRRPDIRRAEAELHAATARYGVAVADLFPRLTLNASVGLQAQHLGDLFTWASRFASIGPGLVLPVFDAGRRRARIRIEDLRTQEAALGYARTVLGALHEVQNAIIAYESEQRRRQSLEQTLAENRKVLAAAREQYRHGLASFLEVLDAERSLHQTESLDAESTTSVYVDLVALYKALGGGWDTAAN